MDLSVIGNLLLGKWKKHEGKPDIIIIRGVEIHIDKFIKDYMDLQDRIDAVIDEIMRTYNIEVRYDA